jgi:gluconolactonase
MIEEGPAFVTFDDRFRSLVGTNPTLEVLFEHQDYPFAHEAGVYIPSTHEIFITSNQFSDDQGKRVQISKVTISKDGAPPSREEIPSDDIPMGNGGVNYKGGILFCAQGSMTLPSGLYEMSASPPYTSQLFISDFYGRPFNSVNDVIIHSDGSIWFTDPIYGYEQGYRPKPQLPNQVYRYEPRSRSIRAMADRFGRPNGICFSPNEKIVYVTDTDWIHGNGSTEGVRPSTM